MRIDKVVFYILVIGMITSIALFVTSMLLSSITKIYLSAMLARIGVEVLIATPYITIASIVVMSVLKRDYRLLVLALIVLIIMMLSLTMSLVLHATP
ncbi:MAG: hypothetical protein DRN15_06040 [Thermoprotei archaeon]|nr:MAG: hypothetical protein DRM97_07385 [Thermoprotei archaeon]RLF23498.1 MAG: hypothetical protein DRN15_06040 [Thermoprotei archaeon]